MSRWQRAQLWLVMKNADGMMPLTFVLADDGKNGPLGPAPSPSMVAGVVVGFTKIHSAAHLRVHFRAAQFFGRDALPDGRLYDSRAGEEQS